MPRPSLFEHPKFKRLVRRLQLPKPYVLGHLEYLWRVGCSTGNPVIGDATDIELAAEWTGPTGVLAEALEQERFLDRLDDGRLEIHDLFENAPEYVTKFAEREVQRRMERACEQCGIAYRSSDPRSQYCSRACKTAQWRKRRSHGGGDGDVTDVSVTETERDGGVGCRDGIHGTHNTHSTHGTHAEEGAAPSADDAPPAALEFPTVGKGGGRWALASALVDEWQELYPGLDVLAECRRALAWCRANPRRCKTGKGMPAFLVSWLNREQNRGGGSPTTPTAGYRPMPLPAYTDWREECRAVHGGRCTNATFHDAMNSRAS